jgi:hypothetical protein
VTDLVEKIAEFEAGELEDLEIFELFQRLINSGLAYRLQGSYGRTAEYLIESGHCHDPQPAEHPADDGPGEDSYTCTFSATGAGGG